MFNLCPNVTRVRSILYNYRQVLNSLAAFIVLFSSDFRQFECFAHNLTRAQQCAPQESARRGKQNERELGIKQKEADEKNVKRKVITGNTNI